MTATDTITTREHLRLRTPIGDDLRVRTGDLTVELDDDVRVTACHLRLFLDREAWGRADREALFHLDPEARGEGADAFIAEGEVEIVAKLDPTVLATWPAGLSDARGAAAWLASLAFERPRDPSLATESWWALSVLQAVALPAGLPGQLATGFRTRWAAPDALAATNEDVSIAAALEAYFRLEGWDYGRDADAGVYTLRHVGDHGAWTCVAGPDDDGGRCLFYSHLPLAIAPERAGEIVELVTRINHGLPIGNFELDLDRPAVRFKTSVDLDGLEPSIALVRGLAENNVAVVDHYLPAFRLVLDERVAPAEAVRRVEAIDRD